MSAKAYAIDHSFFSLDRKALLQNLSPSFLLEQLEAMLLIRTFETRAETAYQMGNIGGFFHSYVGQEAIQTAVVAAFGRKPWYITSYRCHALALLLGATPEEVMAELYGKATGNAKGRGGSMHLYTDRLLGGFGIVGGQIPIATGAAFSLQYLGENDRFAVCFLGDGAVAQGVFHESLNLASLWNLPILYVIENNIWGMGTSYDRALCVERIAEEISPAYRMAHYTADGSDFLSLYGLFRQIGQELLHKRRPIIVEAVAERFRGHSISDPAIYRTKEELERAKGKDPLCLFEHDLFDEKILNETTLEALSHRCKERVTAAMNHAKESPWPNPSELETGVFAPNN